MTVSPAGKPEESGDMPFVKRPGKPELHYALDDYTDPWRNAPYLILQHGLGRSGRFWYSVVPYLPRIQAPVLGLYPTGGPIVTPEHEQVLRSQIKNLQLVNLPSTFHKVQMMFPAGCATSLLHFAAQHDGIACRES